ncbi:hypothetical protein [Candidatus Clostridium radicumherbarum]|uniref:Uncharacterized protein n=1 Tax=Candidatus Clostridium radicumherbarum TaxID=3381662 RepID=A0ABW8TY27_9CLOT
MQQNREENQIGVYILEDNYSDFIKELAEYNLNNNLGEEVFLNCDTKVDSKKITIEDFWFLAV